MVEPSSSLARRATLLFVLGFSCAAGGAFAQSSTFARTDYPFLGNDHNVGDFNGDGRIDLTGTGLLTARAKPVQDTPTPSPNGVAALTAARLAHHLDAPEWHQRHRALVRTFAGRAAELGLYGATFLTAMTWGLSPVTQLVIVGEDAEADRMHRRALRTFIPRKIVQRLHRPPEDGRPSLGLPPHLSAMLDGSAPRAYVCRGASCLAPAANDTE